MTRTKADESVRLPRDGCGRMAQDPSGFFSANLQRGVAQAIEIRMGGILADLDKAKGFIEVHELRG